MKKVLVVLTLLTMTLHTEGGTYTLNFIITAPAGVRNLDGVRLGAVNVTKNIVEGSSGQFKPATETANSARVCYAVAFAGLIDTLNVDPKYLRGEGYAWNIRCPTATYNDGETIIPVEAVTVVSDVTAQDVNGNTVATVTPGGRFQPFDLVRPDSKEDLSSFARFVLVSWENVSKKTQK